MNPRRKVRFAAFALAVLMLLAAGCGTGESGGAPEVPDNAIAEEAAPGASRITAFDPGRAMEHISQLSVGIGPRVSGTPAEQRAAGYIRDSFSGMGYAEVAEQPFSSGPGLTSYNVYAVDEGARPEWVIVVGAHYDTADATGSPGANDNASGVGVMLELARVFHERDNLPTLVFAAFGSEEESEEYYKEDLEYGSVYMADHLDALGGEVVGMVNLDMVGVGFDAFIYSTLEDPEGLSDLFLDFAEDLSARVGYLHDPGDWSDNESFEEAGISSFTLEWQLDVDYHTPQDAYANIDSFLISKSGLLIEGFLGQLSAFDCRLLEKAGE